MTAPNNQPFAEISDLEDFWKTLSAEENKRAETLLVLASDELRQIALNRNKNIDEMLSNGRIMQSVIKKIVLESVKRAMLMPLDQAPVNSMSQGAGPYSETLTFTNPAGDLWFKDKELKLIGLKGQKMAGMKITRKNIYRGDNIW